MRISVRMLGIIGTLLTLFLFMIAGVVLFSAAESLITGKISASLGAPSGFQITQGAVKVGFPLTIVNKSPYDFTDVSFKVDFGNTTGYKLVESNATIDVLKSATNATTTIGLIFNYTRFLKDGYKMILFNDTTFQSTFYFGLTYAYLFGLRLNVSSEMQWGAPLYGLTIGKPQPNYSGTTLTIGVPVKFSNHSPFDISGRLKIDLEDNTGSRIGGADVDMTTKSGQDFNKSIEMVVPLKYYGGLTAKLNFSTDVFSYGPMVFSFAI